MVAPLLLPLSAAALTLSNLFSESSMADSETEETQHKPFALMIEKAFEPEVQAIASDEGFSANNQPE